MGERACAEGGCCHRGPWGYLFAVYLRLQDFLKGLWLFPHCSRTTSMAFLHAPCCNVARTMPRLRPDERDSTSELAS
ncbi:unnamed protein product [Lampetra planeri]